VQERRKCGKGAGHAAEEAFVFCLSGFGADFNGSIHRFAETGAAPQTMGFKMPHDPSAV
jgi:hypothetical protein